MQNAARNANAIFASGALRADGARPTGFDQVFGCLRQAPRDGEKTCALLNSSPVVEQTWSGNDGGCFSGLRGIDARRGRAAGCAVGAVRA